MEKMMRFEPREPIDAPSFLDRARKGTSVEEERVGSRETSATVQLRKYMPVHREGIWKVPQAKFGGMRSFDPSDTPLDRFLTCSGLLRRGPRFLRRGGWPKRGDQLLTTKEEVSSVHKKTCVCAESRVSRLPQPFVFGERAIRTCFLPTGAHVDARMVC